RVVYTASFAVAYPEENPPSAERALNAMMHGALFVKYRPTLLAHASREERLIVLDRDHDTLRVRRPGEGDRAERRINITAIREVRDGASTKRFHGLLAADGSEVPAGGGASTILRCFSIVYGRDYKTLDLIAADPLERR